MLQHIFQHMHIMPVEKFCVVTPQTPLKFLGQNLFGDHLRGQSEAGKLWPQAILGPGAIGLTGGLPLDLRLAWGHTFLASDEPQKWSPNRFWPKNLSGV